MSHYILIHLIEHIGLKLVYFIQHFNTLSLILQKLFSGHKNTIGYIDSVVNNMPAGIYEVLILMEYCKGMF